MLKLWNSNMKSQVSSRRFFMYCPCLYGLQASPVRLRKKRQWGPQTSASSSPTNQWLLSWNLTWSGLMLVLMLRSEVSAALSSAVRWSLLWRSAWGSLRGLTARLHLVIPRRAGPRSYGWLTSCRDIQLLNPIQSEIPELRIICRANRPVVLSEVGLFTTLSKLCRALWWWLTSPAKYSSLLLGFLCPADVLSVDAGVTSGPGGVKKNTCKLKFQIKRHFNPAITKINETM